ncbi:MAG: inositol monophosphatase family protein [Caldilineaceae bacterium]
MKLTDEALQAWRAVAETAATEAGALLRQKLFEPRELKLKGFRDPVTDADVAAQQVITNLVRQHFPDHGFLAEEPNSALPTAGPVHWIIDPLDGTSNYSRSIPEFCVSIAVAFEGAVVVGVIYDPMRDELFSGAHGHGCTLNGRPIHARETPPLDDALISLDWGREEGIRQAMFMVLGHFIHQVRSVRAIGTSALALAWVATGRFDAYVNFHLSPWDFAAGYLLLQEAGGVVTDLAGQPLDLMATGAILAATQSIHADLQQLLTQ